LLPAVGGAIDDRGRRGGADWRLGRRLAISIRSAAPAGIMIALPTAGDEEGGVKFFSTN